MTQPDAETLLICPLTAGTLDQMRCDMFRAVRAGATAVEFRLDLLDRLPALPALTSVLAEAPVPTIVTCRPVRQGGRYDGPEQPRLALLAGAASAGATLIDVEADVPASDRPGGRAILSHHDFQAVPDDLGRRLGQMDAAPAAVNKVAFTARGPEDAITAAGAIRTCTKPTVAMAMGQEGLLSRLAARTFGAWGTFAALDEEAASAPGQPTLAQMRDLYRWDRQGPETMLFGVIGWPVAHSMSPAIHNAALSAADVDGLYVPLLVRPGRDDFFRLLDAIRANPWLRWRGLSVTIPHKSHALEYVGQAHCDPLAVRIGAVNTITFGPDGTLAGDNTDYAAALDSLCGAMNISPEQLGGRDVAVLGAGGVARAVVAGLAQYHAEVTVYNRTRRRAEELAAEFDARARDLSAAPGRAEIVINCTSVGMHPDIEQSPLKSLPESVQVVFDTIYNPVRTRLLGQARDAGATPVTGLEMFVAQAAAQFERWIPRQAPRDVMRQVILDHLA